MPSDRSRRTRGQHDAYDSGNRSHESAAGRGTPHCAARDWHSGYATRGGLRCRQIGAVGLGVSMTHPILEIGHMNQQREEERLTALRATGILDTPPEAGYDAVRSEPSDSGSA